jgi:hypothetical protein
MESQTHDSDRHIGSIDVNLTHIVACSQLPLFYTYNHHYIPRNLLVTVYQTSLLIWTVARRH